MIPGLRKQNKLNVLRGDVSSVKISPCLVGGLTFYSHSISGESSRRFKWQKKRPIKGAWPSSSS
jgi:hypothetical protein